MTLKTRALASACVLAMTLTACGGGGDSADSSADQKTVTITDNTGKKKVPSPPTSVVATDNRTFETLSDWGVELKAAPVPLIPDTVDYSSDSSIADLGLHTEPDLESVVAVKPDLIINGQRFAEQEDKLAELAPKATIVDLDPREDKPFAEELKRQVTTLGTIFDKKDEAEKLTDGLDDAMKRAKDAYSGQSVMAVTTSGGEIGYIAPKVGRTLGPLFEDLDLKPALDVKGASDDHEGDEISVEAIADSDPDWILVMDRDAALDDDSADYRPAKELLEKSAALKNVTAVKEGNIVYMPRDTYLNEGIQTYTEFLTDFADRLEAKN